MKVTITTDEEIYTFEQDETIEIDKTVLTNILRAWLKNMHAPTDEKKRVFKECPILHT